MVVVVAIMLRQLAAEDHVHYQLMLMVPGSGTCNAGATGHRRAYSQAP